ncbi:hypothetical protein BCR42DRAFT_426730 [Absidia repens]|uniref:SAP domain-containing protein n=1 Tax=Absidia repens TaxID=90262 RepID=A0A1X2I104_9FUNG|nr:hypothetical protein BCR42DRAFT_426730 [Absidia repens]
MSDKYKNLKVKELQELLQKTGLPHTGKKEELIERLVKHDETKALELESLEAEFGNLEDFDEAKLNLDELADPDLKSFQPESKEKTSESNIANIASTDNSTTTSSQEPITKEGSGFKFNPIVFDKKPPTASPTSGAVSAAQSSTTTKDKATTEAERKLERAKRFGVQVNEKTKQEMRAARFGTNKSSSPSLSSPRQSSAETSPASKGIDPEVLRKRAERFGLPDKTVKSPKTTTTLSPEEEEKKRKRAERFGSDASKKMKN